MRFVFGQPQEWGWFAVGYLLYGNNPSYTGEGYGDEDV